MEITTLFIGILLGAIIGAVILYFVLKSSHLPRKTYDDVNQNFIRTQSELENSASKIQELNAFFQKEKETNQAQTEILNQLKNEIATLNAEYTSIQNQFREQREINAQQTAQINQLIAEKQDIFGKNSELNAINETLKNSLENQKEEITKMQELAKNEFQNLATKILEEKTKKFTETNRENLDLLLKPLGENLETFKKRVNEVYDNEARERFSLNNTIKLMMEQTNKISQEANNLATALKGQTKTQGDWGELILERILEDSGLTKDREYFTQFNIKNENGENQRPDFMLKLPGNQIVIIDSKVSLNAYERMVSAENEDDRNTNLKLHIAAVRKHVDTLALKRYDHLKESLDFTIMFIPVEPAFLTALQYDTQLWNYAYKKHIILLSPTNLIAYLKLISDVWKRADQNQNAEEIARQAGALFDKFEGFVSDLLKIGKKMDDAKGDYENAMKKLTTGRGNLVGSVQRIKQLGASTRKHLPEALLERANDESEISLFDEKEENNQL
ncbi:DNA recombination protein RmuC [Chryseobacterium sp. H3056]|jgi:DNA recombination protein RmuC|uniref:DNA recombination protein RmuC n=1 Tax=Kaistella daneshvariae TaxID=2487074 RepID=A0A3N0WTB6_9FLAO|nr:DNA recombination protein RmuC [Kaistella daneshvariae]ROI08203.1 DNA recombination protein RmuC [Kaistella daneshvariae]